MTYNLHPAVELEQHHSRAEDDCQCSVWCVERGVVRFQTVKCVGWDIVLSHFGLGVLVENSSPRLSLLSWRGILIYWGEPHTADDPKLLE